MKQLLYFLKLSNTKFLLVFFITVSFFSKAQINRAFELYGGILANKTLCNTIRESDQYDNAGKGGINPSFECGFKFKYSKHFSVEFGYERLKQQITSSFDDLNIIYISPYTHGGTFDYGKVSYTDNIYLNGNHFHIGMNYEFNKGLNNFSFGLNLSVSDYRSKSNIITRDYSKLETLVYTPNSHYQSYTVGKIVKGINAQLKYERMVYKNKIGIYGKLIYQYNIKEDQDFEYGHSGLGYEGIGYFEFISNSGRFTTSNYYHINFNSLILSVGLSYKFNFKNNKTNIK